MLIGSVPGIQAFISRTSAALISVVRAVSTASPLASGTIPSAKDTGSAVRTVNVGHAIANFLP